MIAEEYLSRSRLFRHLRNGPYSSYVELYASRLVKVGLNRHGTWRSLNLLGDLMSLLSRIGLMPTDLNERMSPHVLRHSAAMELLQAGVDCSVIALWLGHESIETTQTYLHAHLALKEAALAKLKPYEPGKRIRFHPSDRLLAFLEAL